MIKSTISTPLTHYIGELEGYSFAVRDYLPGIPLRDLLRKLLLHDLRAIMSTVGIILSKIRAYKFPKAGFLDNDLNVVADKPFSIFAFTQNCLNDRIVLSVLSTGVILAIQKAIKRNASLLLGDDDRHLAHGDFDLANILVDKINDSWAVTGILDWEFAFSGSCLWDIANMLRYAHKMPPEFQNSFIYALQRNGTKLPPNWRTTTHLLNLSSLLDLLRRSDADRHSNRCADIIELIDHILLELNHV